MKPSAVNKLVKAATYRREIPNAVDISNGIWLVRIHKSYWPSGVDTRTARRLNEKAPWELSDMAPDFDRVMPCAWDAEVTTLDRARFGDLPILTLQASRPDTLSVYQLADGIPVYFDAELTATLDACGIVPAGVKEQTPTTAAPLAYAGKACGAIMPCKVRVTRAAEDADA